MLVQQLVFTIHGRRLLLAGELHRHGGYSSCPVLEFIELVDLIVVEAGTHAHTLYAILPMTTSGTLSTFDHVSCVQMVHWV